MNLIQQHVEDEDEEENYVEGGYYYRAIKFKSGEEIICGLTSDDLNYTIKKYIKIYNPMCVEPGVSFRDWSELADEDWFEISTDMIRSMYRVKEKIETKYLEVVDGRYYEHLRELLTDSSLSDDERLSIEQELSNADIGDESLEDDVFGPKPTNPKLLH